MQLRLLRVDRLPVATLGELLVDGAHECFTHEAPLRTDSIFIPGESALPAGFYNVSLAPSTKYRRELPLLASTRPKLDTADRRAERRLARIGMWIHPGHPVDDSDGLLLLGQVRSERTVARTRPAFDQLLKKLHAAVRRGEAIDLEIPA